MRLNLDYYKQDVDFCISEEEKQIIEYIDNNETEINSDAFMLGLSKLRENLIHAYEFNANSVVLEIGAHLGEITGALCEKNQRVIAIEECKIKAEAIAKRHNDKENLEIIVGKLQDINFKEKYDYITLIGVLEYSQKYFNTPIPAVDLILFCKQLLKPNGRLLIATNNKFALKSYVGDIDECTNITFDSITDYKSSEKIYKLGKNQIEKILNQVGLNYYKFLYPLPDYKLPSLIFSDEYLPSSSKINGYFPYYNKNSSIFYSEVDAYDAIIKDNKEMFPYFANSYFIEASQEHFISDTRYVSFNNYRKQEYQLMTKIKKDVVQKSSINEKSEKHLQNMLQNIKNLKNENMEILDIEKDGKVESTFINKKLASQIISDNLNNKQRILQILDKYKETILHYSIPYNENKETVFDKYNIKIEKDILSKFNYLKNGYWDMILKNCFIIDEKCVFFDQEWVEKNVPVEFLIYRSIVNIEKLRNKIDEYNIFEKMGIKEFITIFQELDGKIVEQIIDKEIFSFYTRTYKNPIYENYKIQGENNNLKQENTKIMQQYEQVLEDNKKLNEKCEQLQNVKEELKENIEQKDKKATELEEVLEDIYQSKTWKFANSLAKIKRKLKK